MTIDTAKKLLNNLNKNVAERIAYEQSKRAESAITKVINYCKLDRATFKTTLSEAFFQKLIDAKALESFDFINNHAKESQRFNVYAIEKAMHALHAVASQQMKANKYDVACIVTCLMNRDKESFSFTRKHALSMLSKALKFDNVARSDFSITFNVSESTASTQVSSSFRALEALNVLKFDESDRERSTVSQVNYDHALVKLICEKFDIKLA
ncbi:MAG: hypothetical protein LPK02_07045 [Rhodobacterales bacterium]|nr:hypothetical protein [Rhodobacterales bacterium]